MIRLKKFKLSLLVLLISVFCFNLAASVSANEMKPIRKIKVESQENRAEKQKQIKKLGSSDSINETVTQEAKKIESKGLKRISRIDEESYASGDVIVLFKDSSAVNTVKDSAAAFSLEKETQQVHALAKSLQARVLKTYPELSNNSKKVFALVHSDTKSATELLKELKNDPNVLGASLNYREYLDATPNDTHYSKLWGMKAINADKVWDNGYTGSNTIYTAVIDTGITTNHEDLQANIDTTYSRNFSDSSGYGDKDGHGSHVAGTIAAVGNNSKGVVGVNWTSKIIALRVFNDKGICYNSWVIDAVNYLCNLLDQNPSMNIAAVNMSLGHCSSTTPSQHKSNNDPYYVALSTLSKKNRIVICTSAGNDGLENGVPAPSDDPDGNYKKGDYHYPSDFIDIDNKIVVAAANNDSSYSRADFSNYSKKYCDVTAPGVGIASTVCDNQYAYYNGTSMAAPHVAGVATLLKSIYPNKTAAEIKAAIKNGANSSYGTGYTINGLLDAYGALNYLNGGTTPTDIQITGTLPNGTVGVEYSGSLTAKGGMAPYDWYYKGDWPDGIDGRYNDTTLSFTGTPTKSGTYNLVIIAEDANGNTAEKSFTITINDNSSGSMQITGTLPNGTVGTSYSATLKVTGGTKPYFISWFDGLPDGLEDDYVNENTGEIKVHGTPTTAGTYKATCTVYDDNLDEVEKTFAITIAAKSTKMTMSGTFKDATVGTSYTGTAKVSGGTAPYTWTKSGTATWIDFKDNKKTGASITFSGTPTKAGTFTLILNAVDANKSNVKKTFNITVLPKLTISGTFKGATVGASYTGTAKVTGGTASYTWTKSGVPTGLTFKSSGANVTLSGTPTKAGTFTLKLTVTDANKLKVSKSFSIVVAAKPTISGTFKGATLGTSYTGTAKVTGGTASYTWTKSGVPTGLTFKSSGANVTLSGTPTKAGTFTLKLTVTDANKVKVSKSFSIVVAAKPTISGTFKGATLGASYTGTAKVTGGTSPYTWTKSGVPTGLTFKSSGANVTLSGTPTKAGTFTLKLTVTDANKVKVSKSFSIVVAAKPTLSGTFDAGKVGTTYNGTAKVTGGTAPYTWSKSGVPTGLTFKSSGANVTLSGTPTTAKTYSFKLTVKDANGATATKTFSVKVAENKTSALKMSGTFPNGFIDEAYEASIKVSGGSSPYKWTKDSGTLPKGLKLTTTSTGTTLKLKGTPSAAQTYKFKLTLTDAKGASVSKTFTVIINDEIEISSVRTNSTKDFSTEDVVSNYEPATTELKILDEDVLWQGEGRDEDLFEVKANEPVRFVIGEWKYSNGVKAEIFAEDVEIYVDDKLVEGVTVSDEGEFTIPAEFVVDDFKVQARAKELETFELFISAIE